MISHEILSRPWEKVGCDLFNFQDKHYLVWVHYYSDYSPVERIFWKKGKRSYLKSEVLVCSYGIPDQLISDNGPPFSSREFQEFALAYELSTSQAPQGILNLMGKLRMRLKWLKILWRRPNLQEQIQICLYLIIKTLRLRALEALLLSDCLDGELVVSQIGLLLSLTELPKSWTDWNLEM